MRLPPGRLPAAKGVLLAVLLAACDDSPAPTPVEPEPGPPGVQNPIGPVDPPPYRVAVPAGKLPWPQHNPDWDQRRYQAMLDSLWVVNNFGLYQGGDDRAGLYLHDGLDVSLPNGTPIYAVEDGTVRANLGGSEFYRSLVVEDTDEPGGAWGYTHIYHFRVSPGDRVKQGTLLGFVNFQGLEHIHLDRLRLREGGSWTTWAHLAHLQPDTFFVYRDTEPPVFEGRFRYVRNGTDSAFVAASPSAPVEVSGEVDIVVGLRDPGEWARSKAPWGGPTPYGDRNAPNRVEVAIAGASGVVLHLVSFDLSRLAIPGGISAASSRQVLTLYQFYPAVTPAAPPVGNYNRKFNFFVVTNTPGPAQTGQIDPAWAQHSWRTAERGSDGARRFPDGEYTVTVRAYDFRGNVAARSETVRVRN